MGHSGRRVRNPSELRTLGQKLRSQPGMVTLLAAFDGKKLSLVIACAEDTGLDARELLIQHLAPLGGRGGGGAGLAQGGGQADESTFESLFANTKGYLAG